MPRAHKGTADMVVPNGWRSCRFGDIAEFRNGLNFLALEKGFTIKVAGVGDFRDGHELTSAGLDIVSLSQPVGEDDLLQENDLLFVRSNGNKRLIGRCLLVRGLTEKVAYSGFTIRARLTDRRIRADFVNLQMRSMSVKKQLFRLGAGTNISNLSQDILRQIIIIVPTYADQTAIVEALSLWQTGIEQLDALIHLKFNQRSSLMQQLLTANRRLPGHKGPWKTIHLGQLFGERSESGHEDLSLLSITADRGVIPREEIDRKDSSAEDKSKYKRIAPGDIGYNTMRMWQGVSAVSRREGIVSPAYTVCIPKEKAHADFMGYLFKYPPVVHAFFRHSQGLVDDTLNLKFHHFAQVHVTIPTAGEQQAIAEVLSTCDRELALLQRQLDLLKLQKRGLMQKLLTGQVRVKGKE